MMRLTWEKNLGRRRALDRAMDLALKNPTKRRRRAGEVVRAPSLFISPFRLASLHIIPSNH